MVDEWLIYLWHNETLARLTGILILICLLLRLRSLTYSRPDHRFTTCNSPNCLRCCNKTGSPVNKSVSLTRPVLRKLPRIKKWLEDRTITDNTKLQQPTVFFLPDLSTSPVIKKHFHEHDAIVLESSYHLLAKEYFKISDSISETTGWKTNSTPSGSWSVFYLINQGETVSNNAERCPATMEVLQKLSGLLRGCAFGNACFSVVEPGTTISEHYGPCNVRTRCHLGMLIPKDWYLVVNNVSLAWEQGSCLLFDDSFLHSVHSSCNENSETKECRIVFMVDLWHYGLTNHERSVISNLYPAR